MSMPPRKGGVFLVNDRLINLPPDDARNYHGQRYVIIVSGNGPNSNGNWPLVLAVPASTQSTLKTQYCVTLAQGTGNLPKKCWARVVAVQPIAKADLGDYAGEIPASMMTLLEQNLLAYMGLID
jgi:mRNA-degrading endonuclease toxin of MazEF toxin-antitoxin module